jgi:hypothetical protein
MNETITVAFANRLAPEILENYFDKRAAWYQQRLNLPTRHARQDEFDAHSHIVLATDGHECVGGLRATIRQSSLGKRLPMEIVCPQLRLENLFPDLGLEFTPHAELSKLIVHSSRHSLSFQNDIVDRLLRFTLFTHNPEPTVPVVFILAPKLQMRIYTSQARTLGLNFDVRQVPEALLISELQAQAPIFIQACYLAPPRIQLN